MDGEDTYIMMTYEGQSRLVARPRSQAAAQARAVREFDLPRGANIKFAVDWRGRRVEIGKDSFAIIGRADEVFVLVNVKPRPTSRQPQWEIFIQTLSE
jgi:hypothetical protein